MGRQKSWNNQAIAVCFELCKQHPTKTEPQTGIPRTTNYIKRKKSAMQPLHQENVPVKAKLGRRYFLYRKWQHFKLFQATEILLLLKQRETTALMWEPRTSLCSSSGGFPSPLQFQEIQPFPELHMKPPGATSLQQLLELIGRDPMNSSQGFWFLQTSRKSSKNTPSAAIGKTRRRQMGWRSYQRTPLPSGLSCFSTTSASKMSCFPKLWHGRARESSPEFPSVYLSDR